MASFTWDQWCQGKKHISSGLQLPLQLVSCLRLFARFRYPSGRLSNPVQPACTSAYSTLTPLAEKCNQLRKCFASVSFSLHSVSDFCAVIFQKKWAVDLFLVQFYPWRKPSSLIRNEKQFLSLWMLENKNFKLWQWWWWSFSRAINTQILKEKFC